MIFLDASPYFSVSVLIFSRSDDVREVASAAVALTNHGKHLS